MSEKIDFLISAKIDFSKSEKVDFSKPEEIEKHYKSVLLLVARIIYVKFFKGPLAPYIQLFILLIIVLPSKFLIQFDKNFIVFLYWKLINNIGYDENQIIIDKKQHLLKKINKFCKTQIKSFNNKMNNK